MIQGRTIQDIKAAVAKGRLNQPFRPSEVDRSLGIHYASTFLPKHRVGNPGGNTELFVRVGNYPVTYRLR